LKKDDLIKSIKSLAFVTPAKAGVRDSRKQLDSRFRGNDTIFDFLQSHQNLIFLLYNNLYAFKQAEPNRQASFFENILK